VREATGRSRSSPRDSAPSSRCSPWTPARSSRSTVCLRLAYGGSCFGAPVVTCVLLRAEAIDGLTYAGPGTTDRPLRFITEDPSGSTDARKCLSAVELLLSVIAASSYVGNGLIAWTRRPGADIAERAHPIHAGVGPEVDEDDLPPQVLPWRAAPS
jgi:hypothetical protein